MHQQSTLLLLFILSLGLTTVFCTFHLLPEQHQSKNNTNVTKLVPVIPLKELKKSVDQADPIIKILVNSTNAVNHNGTIKVSTKSATELPKLPHGSDEMMQSGALQRGFFVLLGGTVLLLIFLGLRMYRLQKGGYRPYVMVRKYGVVASRKDVEMVPLPLDEDDEDDTVFEVNTHIENHS